MARLGPTGLTQVFTDIKNWVNSKLSTKADTAHTHTTYAVKHAYTTAANAAKNWYRIANANTKQVYTGNPIHAEFILTAYNSSYDPGYSERWYVRAMVLGRNAHVIIFGSTTAPFSQCRVLYENTLADIDDNDRPAIDIYLNYVFANGTTKIEIEEVYNQGWTFVADGQLAVSTVPTGFENTAVGVRGNGVERSTYSDIATYLNKPRRDITSNVTLADNNTYRSTTLNCTGTRTITLPSINSNYFWCVIKNFNTEAGIITIHPSTTSVLIDGSNDDIILRPGEFVAIHSRAANSYSIVGDNRKRTCLVGRSGAVGTDTKHWFRVAQKTLKTGYRDAFILFDVFQVGADSTYMGRLCAHVRVDGTVGVVGNKQFSWLYRGTQLSDDDFAMTTIETSGTSVVVDIWCKRAGSYSAFAFAIVSEGFSTDSLDSPAGKWILTRERATVGDLESLDTGFTTVTNPSVVTLANSITGNAGSATVAQQVRKDPAAGSTADLLYSQCAGTDIFRLQVGGASNAGYAEIATADDGSEPIYVRQYKGTFTSLQRTATLLDGSGNTSFPGTVTATGFSGPLLTTIPNDTIWPVTASTTDDITYLGANAIHVEQKSSGKLTDLSNGAWSVAELGVGCFFFRINSGTDIRYKHLGQNTVNRIPVVSGANRFINDVTPNADDTYSLGTSSLRWSSCYSNAYYLGTTAFGDIVTHNASEFLTTSGNETVTGTKIFNGDKIVITQGNGYRMVCNTDGGSSGYGVFQRVDSANWYLMVTAQNDALGSWTSARPASMNLSTGVLSINGNAATATQFSANKDVTLTGDVTGTASSKAGWSVATTLANSGVTAGTYGPSADVTGNNNATISVPEITVDAKGRVTSVTNRTLTCKNNTYNVYNKTLTIQKNGTNVATFTSNSNTDVTANITVPTKVSELTNDSGYLTSHQSLANYLTKTTNVSEMGRYIDLHYDNATSKYDYDARLYVDSQGTAAGGGSFKIAAASAYAPAPASNANDTRIATTAWVNSKGYLTSHPSITLSTNTTSTASPAHGGTFTCIDSVTQDTNGHITKVNTKTITLPADSNTDTKVTQTVTTDNSGYPVLLCATANATATKTTTSRFSAGLTVNARYSSIYMTNKYDTANTKGVRDSTKGYLNGDIIFRCYDASEMGRIHCESSKNGYQQTYMQARSYIKDGAIDPEGTSTTCYITVRVRDNGSKTIYTDGSWENSLTPYANNTYSLGTQNLKWKDVYANNYYKGTTAFGDIVTHNASEFLTAHPSISINPDPATNSPTTLQNGSTFTYVSGMDRDANGHVRVIFTTAATVATNKLNSIGTRTTTGTWTLSSLPTNSVLYIRGTVSGTFAAVGNYVKITIQSGADTIYATGFTTNASSYGSYDHSQAHSYSVKCIALLLVKIVDNSTNNVVIKIESSGPTPTINLSAYQ